MDKKMIKLFRNKSFVLANQDGGDAGSRKNRRLTVDGLDKFDAAKTNPDEKPAVYAGVKRGKSLRKDYARTGLVTDKGDKNVKSKPAPTSEFQDVELRKPNSPVEAKEQDRVELRVYSGSPTRLKPKPKTPTVERKTKEEVEARSTKNFFFRKTMNFGKSKPLRKSVSFDHIKELEKCELFLQQQRKYSVSNKDILGDVAKTTGVLRAVAKFERSLQKRENRKSKSCDAVFRREVLQNVDGYSEDSNINKVQPFPVETRSDHIKRAERPKTVSGNIEGLESPNTERNQKAKKNLKFFFKRRPSKYDLETKGILNKEEIFGNSLVDIYNKKKDLPEFIYETIKLIEEDTNVKSLGIYRTSGNLATIQKIRYKVDNGKWSIIHEYKKDVDVLTGALKLFFRELETALIPKDVADEIDAIKDKKDQQKQLCKILEKMPKIHQHALFVLVKHLLKVITFANDNKMDLYNMAICWGQSLIFLDPISADIVAQSNRTIRIIEFILTYYRDHSEDLEKLQFKVEAPKISRQESKDSVKLPNNTDECTKVVYKVLTIIENKMEPNDALYLKSGSSVKVDKILKKMKKGKVDKLKEDECVHDYADALKKYLKELKLIFSTSVQEYLKTKELKLMQDALNKTNRRDTINLLLKHLLKVLENKSSEDRYKIIDMWSKVLCFGDKVTESDKYCFLDDVVKQQESLRTPKLQKPDLIKDLQSSQSFRVHADKQKSIYDNVKDSDQEEHSKL